MPDVLTRTASARLTAGSRLPGRAHTAASKPEGQGPKTLFEVPFACAMRDRDVALLARTLDVTTHMYAKPFPSPTSPGVVRLDQGSGLFLERGASEGQWVLKGRTWGNPHPQSIHAWHVLAAGAARLLDPLVDFPARLAAVSPAYQMRPVGRAANNRHARIGRRLLGL